MDAFAAHGDAMDFPGHTLGFTHVLACLLDRQAVGRGAGGINMRENRQQKLEA